MFDWRGLQQELLSAMIFGVRISINDYNKRNSPEANSYHSSPAPPTAEQETTLHSLLCRAKQTTLHSL